MLLLSFNMGKERYVIETRNIVEIVPRVHLKRIPGAGESIPGMLNYHGQAIPVIDISMLCHGTAAEDTLTSRIILVNYTDNRILGLLAEKVTETFFIEESEFESSGIQINDFEFLGDLAEHKNGLVQLINVDQLLSGDIQAMLFTDNSGQAAV
ncbi:chemotaxis protein CheW [Sulfuriflexus mobilis]|uniref:chemotaxis protein CheW n=1 Tax=Sulfuriflexus mobilis TaxID=1811807 RepID=UPI000F81F5A4|nr:chemotaxis protein CheW [Sulfuriflexus mobilis]